MACPGMMSTKPLSASMVTGVVAFQEPNVSRANAAQGGAS